MWGRKHGVETVEERRTTVLRTTELRTAVARVEKRGTPRAPRTPITVVFSTHGSTSTCSSNTIKLHESVSAAIVSRRQIISRFRRQPPALIASPDQIKSAFPRFRIMEKAPPSCWFELPLVHTGCPVPPKLPRSPPAMVRLGKAPK